MRRIKVHKLTRLGSKLPKIPKNVRFDILGSSSGWNTTFHPLKKQYSYGTAINKGELCILVDKKNYSGKDYFMIPFKEFLRLNLIK